MKNVPKIVEFIGGIASVIAILVYITGKTSIPDFFVGKELNQPLPQKRPEQVIVKEYVPDTSFVRRFIREELVNRGIGTGGGPGSGPGPGTGTPLPEGPTEPQPGACNLNGRRFGSGDYILFYSKEGNNYSFNGQVSIYAISGSAHLSGNTITLTGENVSGGLTLFKSCSHLEGRIKLRYGYENFSAGIQPEIFTP